MMVQGKRIAITRAEHQAAPLIERLRALGAEPILCPAIAIAPPDDIGPLDAAITQLDRYDWLIVTSANSVRALCERMQALGYEPTLLNRLKIGAIGPATAAALAEYGLSASFIPSTHTAEAMLAELGPIAGTQIFLPQANLARTLLADGLRQHGALVDTVVAYCTVPDTGTAILATALQRHTLDAITFTSSSTVRFVLDGLEREGLERDAARALLNNIAIICIGPVTAETAAMEQLRVAAIAEQATTEGLLDALIAAMQKVKGER